MSPTPNPVVGRATQQHHESSWLRSPREPDSLGRVWRKHGVSNAQIESLTNNVRQIQQQIERLRRQHYFPTTEHSFPFQIRVSPPMTQDDRDYWAAHGEAAGTPVDLAWRSFRVRHGCVGLVNVVGTDWVGVPANGNPDDLVWHGGEAVYDTTLDKVVPSDQTHYYCYIDCSGASPTIAWTATVPTSGWTANKFILIADIDTHSHLSSKRAVVRQYLREDTDSLQDSGLVVKLWYTQAGDSTLSLKGDYMVLKDDNDVAYNVALPADLRFSITTDTLPDSTVRTFDTYSAQYQSRVCHISGDPDESQYIIPFYVEQVPIYAIRCTTGVLDGDGNECGWLDITGGRAWAAPPPA